MTIIYLIENRLIYKDEICKFGAKLLRQDSQHRQGHIAYTYLASLLPLKASCHFINLNLPCSRVKLSFASFRAKVTNVHKHCDQIWEPEPHNLGQITASSHFCFKYLPLCIGSLFSNGFFSPSCHWISRSLEEVVQGTGNDHSKLPPTLNVVECGWSCDTAGFKQSKTYIPHTENDFLTNKNPFKLLKLIYKQHLSPDVR